LDELYRRVFLPLVRRATWNHGLSKEDARDVVQEAFLLAVVKLDPGRNPKAWLVHVVDNLSINLARKASRHHRLEARWGLGWRDSSCSQSTAASVTDDEGEDG
jgi:DNA-directed RNA polymerase specialized sigma24 family protein